MTTARIYWRVVAFGKCEYPTGFFTAKERAEKARWKYADTDISGWSAANTRVYGYASRAAARAGGISDGVGENGRVG